MSDIAKLNAAFHAEIGNVESPKGSNNIKYNTDYYGHAVSGDNYAWCCAFIWWVFRKCGLLTKFCGGNKTAYCPFVVNWARTYNQWVTSGYQLGDILLYDWDGDGMADHIGWCAGTSGNYAKSIEGNSSDAVRMNSQPFSKIMGAYRPVYDTAPSMPSVQPVNDNSGSETPVLNENEYTVKSGDNLWAIGQKLGIPYLDIAKTNGITSPFVIRSGQVLTIPKKGQPITPPADAKPIDEELGDTYTVKSGDTLWGIGQKYRVNYMKIALANNIASPYIIRPGQVLKIPK